MGANMALKKARFRISIKDNLTGRALKIELIERSLTGRYRVKQNGKPAQNIREANLSTVFARLRRWVVSEIKRQRRNG
jgi:hypothetical protein